VLTIIRQSITFLTKRERLKYFLFLSMRGLLALLDLVGVLGIGVLSASIGLFVTQGSDPGRTLELGSISVPAVSYASLGVFSAAILAVFVTKAGLSLVLTKQLALLLARVESRAAKEIASRVFSDGVRAKEQKSRDELLFAIQIGSANAFGITLNAVGVLVAEGLLFALVLVTFAVFDPLSALAAIAYFGLISLVTQSLLGRVMNRTSQTIATGQVQATTAINDLWEVAKEAEVLGRKSYFFDRLFKAKIGISGKLATQTVLSSSPRHILETALLIAIALFALTQVQKADIVSSAVVIGVFLSGGLRLTASLLPLQGAFLMIRQAGPAAERALEILRAQTPVKRKSVADSTSFSPEKALEVNVKDVSFTYSGNTRPALIDISLSITAGSQVAFIGPSGAGKSSLGELILGLLTPDVGSVRVSGLPPYELRTSMPGIISFVPQIPRMVSGTIFDNVTLGIPRSEVNVEQVNMAIQAANLAEVIQQLPEGLETNLGSRHDALSGGQLQRIGLARALYSEPKLLVLDEATSSLDADSENKINQALIGLRGRTTVILIAHRLNTIQHSDQIFLLENGRVSTSGTFQEVLKASGTLKRLVNLTELK
jgi:ATP-binding cassette, subfamily B, bacterial PglK